MKTNFLKKIDNKYDNQSFNIIKIVLYYRPLI